MQSGMAFLRSKGELQQQTKDIFSITSQVEKQCKHHNHQQLGQQQKKKVRQKQKVKKIQKFIRNYIGRHQPLSYRQQYSFAQNWQNNQKDVNPPQRGYYYRSGKIKLVTFMLFPIFIIQLWLFSITRIFSYDNCWWIFLWGLLEIVLFIEEFNKKEELLPQIITFMSREKYSYLIGCGFSLLHHSIALSGGSDFAYMKELSFLVFDLVVVIYRYSLFSEIYSVIRIEIMGTKYRLKMNLFDLSVNVVSMIHIFAALLFLCTYYDPVHNWHQSSPILVEDTWMNNYLQSFYFACTTMLTVGFGDISPTNSLEIICILVVQIIGIVNNAYIINQFGVTLTQIYMRRNMLERDIANAQKLVNFNHLQQQIRQKLLNSLINYQPSNDDLQITQQQSLLSKTSEQIKQQVIQSGQKRAIKMNLYLISTFSKKLLDDLSIKLVKAIYPPHIFLPITRDKLKFYIVAKGSVDIIPDRKITNNNPMKTINVTEENLLNQIYGYGTLFSKKPWRLKAITRSYVICYSCELQDLVDCVRNYEEDYQKYFEICHRIEMYRIPEEYEVPNINSNKQHYVPSIFYLLKNNKSKKFSNTRRHFRRLPRRFPKIHERFDEDQIISTSYGVQQSGQSFADVGRQKEQSKRSIMIQRTLSPVAREINFICKPRNQQARNIINKNSQNFRKFKLEEKKNQELNLSPFRQVFKQFKKYFPSGNITTILSHYNVKIQKKLTKQQIDIIRPPLIKNRFEQLMTRLRKNSENI